MQSKAATVADYLAKLPADRRAEIEKVRAVVRAHLDHSGFEEGMQYGMIGWYVPHRIFPDGYHCDPKQPLPYAGLASQKNYGALYLMGLYGGEQKGHPAHELHQWFVAAWTKSGKKLDMGKVCIRFKRADDLALDVIGEAFCRLTAKRYIAAYTAARDVQAKKGPTPRAEIRKAVAARKTAKAAKKVPAKKAGGARKAK